MSRSGFDAWLIRQPSQRARDDDAILVKAHASFVARDRTCGARRVWRDVLADGVSCGWHRIERIMREIDLRARPRRRGLPQDESERSAASPNLLKRRFAANASKRKRLRADSMSPPSSTYFRVKKREDDHVSFSAISVKR